MLVPAFAHADIAVLLLEATGSGAARYTAAGHSAVYLSAICPETPVKLRLCEEGETGSVISNYMYFGEDGSPEWNISPASVFFYGVEDPADIPLYGDHEILTLLRERYRERYLKDVCSPDSACGSGQGQWGDMAAAAFMRDIYAFRVKTTHEQDLQLIDDFNSRPNVNRYSGFTRNCADFTRTLLNRLMPGSVRADRLNDFGMTSPKAVARSFSRHARRHPELEFSVERYSQIPGPIRRSLDNRNGTEVGFRAKKWSLPLLAVRSHMLAYFAASYYLTAWFNPEREYQAHRIRRSSVPPRMWADYKSRFATVLADAVKTGVFEQKKDAEKYFRVLESEGTVQLSWDGTPSIAIGHTTVGLTRRTILQSDPAGRLMAERILLSRISAALKAPKKNRPDAEIMAADWQLMEQLTSLRLHAQRSSAEPMSSSSVERGPASSLSGQPVLHPTGQ